MEMDEYMRNGNSHSSKPASDVCENAEAMVICLLMEAGLLGVPHSSFVTMGLRHMHQQLFENINNDTQSRNVTSTQSNGGKGREPNYSSAPRVISVRAGTENPLGRSFTVSACCMPLQSGKIHGPFPDCL